MIIPETATAGFGPDEVTNRLSWTSTQLCAMLAEWYYVTGGRPPRRHREVAPDFRPATAEGTLAALRREAGWPGLHPLTASVHQAMVHADLGDEEALTDALNALHATDPEDMEQLLRPLWESFDQTAAAAASSPEQAEKIKTLLDEEYARAAQAFIEGTL